jgi:hypothetical protein
MMPIVPPIERLTGFRFSCLTYPGVAPWPA